MKNTTLENSKVYKDWTKGVTIISKAEDRFKTTRVIVEHEGTYRFLRFYKFKKWVVSCDVEAHEINEFLDKILIQISKDLI